MEYLATTTTHVPEGTPAQAVADVCAREAARSHELAVQGHLLRLWHPPLQPGEWRTPGACWVLGGRSWYFGGAAMLLPAGRGMVVFTDDNALGGEGCA